MTKAQMMGYEPEKVNEMIIILKDKHDEETKLPLTLKQVEDFDCFLNELVTIADKYSLEIEGFGHKKAMLKRLNVKNKESLIPANTHL